MIGEPFASKPIVVGKSEAAAAPPHIPAEESLCPVVSHDWVNSEYKHLVVEASPKALSVTPGQFFNLLCPSPDVGELFFRRPQSVYRIDRDRGRIEFLYKCVGRGTRGLATLKKGDDLNMVGPLGVGFTLDPAWRHIAVLGRGVGIATLGPISQLAREAHAGVTAILSARNADFVMADGCFREAGDVVTVDFHVDLPELYPASFSFSPAIADGTLLQYTMCDWIDNAIALQMGRGEGQIYGYLHLPCRIEINARLRREAPAAEQRVG